MSFLESTFAFSMAFLTRRVMMLFSSDRTVTLCGLLGMHGWACVRVRYSKSIHLDHPKRKAMNNIHYYSLFFFVSDYSQIPRHILHKQLALTKSGRRFAIFNKITSIE